MRAINRQKLTCKLKRTDSEESENVQKADKVLVLGIEGIDPKLTCKYIDEGTQPAGPNLGIAQVDDEKIIIASVKTPETRYATKAAADSKIPS